VTVIELINALFTMPHDMPVMVWRDAADQTGWARPVEVHNDEDRVLLRLEP
jgi:hypothetical protein